MPPCCRGASWSRKQRLKVVYHLLVSRAETKRFQHRVPRVNLHHPTLVGAAMPRKSLSVLAAPTCRAMDIINSCHVMGCHLSQETRDTLKRGG